MSKTRDTLNIVSSPHEHPSKSRFSNLDWKRIGNCPRSLKIVKMITFSSHYKMSTSKINQIFISAFVVVALVILKSNVEAQNSCHLRELDLCAATLLVFTQSPGGLATSEPEIQKQCAHLREANGCFSNYTRRCMTPLQREVISFAANSSMGLLDEYCTKGSKLRSNYLKHSKCLNQIQKGGEQKLCMRDLQASLELFTPPTAPNKPTPNKDTSAGGSSMEHGKRLQLACCTYRRFESCLGQQMEKKCGKETLQFVQSITRRITSRLPENLCRNYRPDGQECRALLPKAGSVPRGSKSNSIISRLLSAYTGL